MEIITTRDQFAGFAGRMAVRADWHEPDEQDLTARVEGVTFDNAGFWPAGAVTYTEPELHVIFSKIEYVGDDPVTGEDIAAVNLATLCAWAAGYREVGI